MTPFGTWLRRERQERTILLGDLAQKLGISTPYLSQIETGQRFVPDGFEDKVIRALKLNPTEVNELNRAAALSRSQYMIQPGREASEADRSLAHDLADAFARLSPEAKAQLRSTLEADRGK